MPSSKRLLGGFVLVASLLLVVALTVSVAPSVTGATHQYGYAVTVGTDATLSNVTLSLPLPSRADASPVGDAIARGEVTAPDGWTASVVDTEFGPMVRLRTAAFVAQRRADERTYDTADVTVSADTERRIDVRAPTETEPVLRPRFQHREVPCPNRGPTTRATCYGYESRVYASYDAPPDANVTIHVVAGGSNAGGITGASRYSERVSVAFRGPQSGWVVAPGTLRTAE